MPMRVCVCVCVCVYAMVKNANYTLTMSVFRGHGTLMNQLSCHSSTTNWAVPHQESCNVQNKHTKVLTC